MISKFTHAMIFSFALIFSYHSFSRFYISTLLFLFYFYLYFILFLFLFICLFLLFIYLFVLYFYFLFFLIISIDHSVCKLQALWVVACSHALWRSLLSQGTFWPHSPLWVWVVVFLLSPNPDYNFSMSGIH